MLIFNKESLMFKYLLSFFILSLTCLFALGSPNNNMPPPRPDKLDFTSDYALMQLRKPQEILATLISDPNKYQLILSDKQQFGGEAIPPQVFSEKPCIIIYRGALDPSVTNEELAFMMAHELGHIHHHHMENFDQRMEKIMTGSPLGISGTTFNIFAQKFEERQADLFGYELYKKAGYDINFFPETFHYIQMNNGHDRHMPKEMRLFSSLSMKDSHFSMQDRFQLLAHKTTLSFNA